MAQMVVFYFKSNNVVSDKEKERYAFPINEVRDILVYREPTRMPDAPCGIKGLLNVRGEVIPIVYLGDILNYSVDYDTAKIIIVSVENERIGFVVQGIEEITKYEEGDISESPYSESSEYSVGVVKVYLSDSVNVENSESTQVKKRKYSLATMLDVRKIMKINSNI